jgi:hypothetical protein
MEVVNSGAMSTDVMQLARDWLGLLTRGLKVAAIGSSDTHTVDFVPIGQARTYIQAPREKAFQALGEGRNLVSYGLATELTAKPDGTVDVVVHGPSWSSVDRIEIYSNGRIAWTDSFTPRRSAGVKYQRSVKLRLPPHDAAIAAVASGPGVLEPFWEVRKPYQPSSPDWTPRVLGVSSAVWIDVDGDGRITSPRQYGEKLAEQPEKLAIYDASVRLHAEEIRTNLRQ